MSNLAPGTYVQESTFPSFNAVNTAAGNAFVFVGAHNRGPTTIQSIQSWGQFVSLYGGFSTTQLPSLLALAVYSFFNNGGGECYVLRITHGDGAAATVVLDAADGTTASLAVDAVNPGAWGDNITVVSSVNTATNRFNLAVYYGGTAPNNLAEAVWTNLSMNPADSRYAPAIINNPLNGSTYISVVDQAASPNTTPGPIPAAGTHTLTGGADGGAAVAADLTASQTELNKLPMPLMVNFPGVSDATGVLGPMLSYLTTGRSFADSVLVCDTASGQTPTAAEAFAAQIGASSYAVVYYPWITVSDPSSNTPGALRTLPPGAFAMAKAAVTDSTRGVWKAPAGYGASLNALAPETALLSSDVGNLVAAGVNPIVFQEGAGICIWGARTLSNSEQTLYLNKRRALIYIESELKALSNFAAFEDNDYVLWTTLTQRLGTFLSRLWASGAFAGSSAASSFFITCDETNNDPTSNVVHIDAGVALASPAEFILISVGQWAGGSSVNETSTAAIGA